MHQDKRHGRGRMTLPSGAQGRARRVQFFWTPKYLSFPPIFLKVLIIICVFFKFDAPVRLFFSIIQNETNFQCAHQRHTTLARDYYDGEWANGRTQAHAAAVPWIPHRLFEANVFHCFPEAEALPQA